MSQKRAGRTVKVSVSLNREHLAILQRHARKAYGGNLSAAFAAAARWLQQQEARRRLIDALGGPTLTEDAARAIETEQAGATRHAPKKKSKRAA